jgi:RimJ/RimL family protein N-acetyltransferase
MTELDRIRAFHALVDERQATEVTRFEHGASFAVPQLPDVYDLNFVRVDRAGTAAEIAAAADNLQARFHHRKVVVPDGTLGKKLAPGFTQLGWSAAHHVHMARLRPPDRKDDFHHVVELPLDRLAPAHRTSTLRADWGDERIADRLLEAKRVRAQAVPTRHFGIVEDDRVVAYCDLYEADGVAQIEDVNTLVEARGRGHGRAIVAKAAAEAAAGAELVFLDAIADDWPRELYARLGFDVVGDTYLFLRYPGPLPALSLRTPRLELRLPTDAEVAELAHAIEEHGIHPREQMPFAIAWTDAIGTPEFVPNVLAHFRAQRAGRQPHDWSLNFVAFLDGHPVGSQSIIAESFPLNRTVATGSYLIRPHQRQGLGTEMRAAVLAFAFDLLGAARAESGAIEGNDASARVSEKLGYEHDGWRELKPRGEPVRERRFVLTRERWQTGTQLPIEITGPLERARVALGAA